MYEILNYSISKSKWTKKPALLGATLTEKCPSWPGTIVTICMSYKKHGISHDQLEEFGKGHKETRVHMSYQHLRILHAGILLAWVMRASRGRTSSDNGWPETTLKLILLPKIPDYGKATLLDSLTLLFSTQGAPSQGSLLLPHHVCVLWHFCMLDKSQLAGPRRGSPYLQEFFLYKWFVGRQIAIKSKLCQGLCF